MLVMTRKPGQTIRVGDAVEIVIVEVRGDQVRLAFARPARPPFGAGNPDFAIEGRKARPARMTRPRSFEGARRRRPEGKAYGLN